MNLLEVSHSESSSHEQEYLLVEQRQAQSMKERRMFIGHSESQPYAFKKQCLKEVLTLILDIKRGEPEIREFVHSCGYLGEDNLKMTL